MTLSRLACAFFFCLGLAWLEPEGVHAEPFEVCVHDALARVRREATEDACEKPSRTTLFRGETFSTQVSVRARVPLHAVRVRPLGDKPLHVFAEHFVDVPKRSRTGAGRESLGFTAEARGDDANYLGALPDALIPLGDAPPWVYPQRLAPDERAVFFVEAFIDEKAPAESVTFALEVEAGGLTERVEFAIDVATHVLPYQPVKSLAYYEHRALERSFGAAAAKVERSLAKLLHAHRLDSFTRVTTASEAARVRGSFDGGWFSVREGYEGPGEGRASEVFVLGAYGRLGDPTDAAMDQVRGILAQIPEDGPSLVVLYAVDETCNSPRGRVWRSRLDSAGLSHVEVLHTCHEPPASQDVNIIAMPGQSFDPDLAEEARAIGKRVWVYNGQLPHAGAPNLDVPLTSLTHNGWLASIHDVDRWFYWETTFWEDIYRGGKGPHDPFATAETFHNAHGDTSLYDGLLVFPGRVPSAVGPHDIGRDEVYPSLRLKALRRGIEDAGLLALAAEVSAARTHARARRVVAAGFDEVNANRAALFLEDAASLAKIREELREIARGGPPRQDSSDRGRDGLVSLREDHRDHRWLVGAGQPVVSSRVIPTVIMPLLLGVFGLVVVLLMGGAGPPRSGRVSSKTW